MHITASLAAFERVLPAIDSIHCILAQRHFGHKNAKYDSLELTIKALADTHTESEES
jgi:hypothetical protein